MHGLRARKLDPIFTETCLNYEEESISWATKIDFSSCPRDSPQQLFQLYLQKLSWEFETIRLGQPTNGVVCCGPFSGSVLRLVLWSCVENESQRHLEGKKTGRGAFFVTWGHFSVIWTTFHEHCLNSRNTKIRVPTVSCFSVLGIFPPEIQITLKSEKLRERQKSNIHFSQQQQQKHP